MNSMTFSTDTAEAPLPSHCSFIEGKYILSLREIIKTIKDSTPYYTQMFIHDKKEYAGMCTTLVPHETHVQTGFDAMEETIKNFHYVRVGDVFQVPYGRALVGYKFTTEHFNTLECLPGKRYPTFSIALPTEYKEMLDAIPDSNLDELEKLWDKENLSDEIKVDYIDNYGNPSTGSTFEFSYWFAHTLATQYLTWCKENQTLSVSTTPLPDDHDTESDSDIEANDEANAEANAKVNKRDPPTEEEEEPIAKRLRSRWTDNNNKRTWK